LESGRHAHSQYALSAGRSGIDAKLSIGLPSGAHAQHRCATAVERAAAARPLIDAQGSAQGRRAAPEAVA
jgi:hypothetical protein